VQGLVDQRHHDDWSWRFHNPTTATGTVCFCEKVTCMCVDVCLVTNLCCRYLYGNSITMIPANVFANLAQLQSLFVLYERVAE